jgi:uncharacterized protein (DUF433 family)
MKSYLLTLTEKNKEGLKVTDIIRETAASSPYDYVSDNNIEIVLNKVFRETAETMAEYIEVNESVMGGTPVIKDTRVPVFVLLNYLANRYSIEDIKRDFPKVSEEAVLASIKFASSIIQPKEED